MNLINSLNFLTLELTNQIKLVWFWIFLSLQLLKKKKKMKSYSFLIHHFLDFEIISKISINLFEIDNFYH